jgi:hypothetical protein
MRIYAQLDEESLAPQLPPDLSPPLPQSRDLMDPELHSGNLSLSMPLTSVLTLQ